ncbi:hypothetical protein E2C01_006346 [Portunus trituberculatus]|uniref:Uncharacterized protein n=1 Tax=Portunus trituberculatus TaxID=210409 RepID=A0A5B7CZ33_PORTR|nr:hypothetical protein [Portunus trituberculatus]
MRNSFSKEICPRPATLASIGCAEGTFSARNSIRQSCDGPMARGKDREWSKCHLPRFARKMPRPFAIWYCVNQGLGANHGDTGLGRSPSAHLAHGINIG